jgi:hypothetical protein
MPIVASAQAPENRTAQPWSTEYRLWVVVMAIGVHVVEEYALDLPGWALTVGGVAITWQDFHLVNACVTVFGIAGAVVGWRAPGLALMTPALVLLNSVGFHIGASFLFGAYSPGTLTSALLFIPAGLWAFLGARDDRVLTKKVLMTAFAGGIGWHALLGILFVYWRT